MINRFAKRFISIILLIVMLAVCACDTFAASGKASVDKAMSEVKSTDDNGKAIPEKEYKEKLLKAREDAGKAITVESDQRQDWPKGPVITATSAVLLDMDSGIALYSKDANERLYPASITKILTALIACENSKPDDKVVFSHDAVYTNMEPGSANMGFNEGEEITMDVALRCMMSASANEVANAIAETIAGSNDKFAEMMNKRVRELGCYNCHFMNPHGLHDDDHYVTASNMAVIASAAYQNEWFRDICALDTYERPVTNLNKEAWQQTNKHEMFRENAPNYYEYCTGGKTGGTDQALSTLVTYAEKDGKRLVCVLLYGIGGQTFPTTKELFEYGFNSFNDIDLSKCSQDYSLFSKRYIENISAAKSADDPGDNADTNGEEPENSGGEDADSGKADDADQKNPSADMKADNDGSSKKVTVISEEAVDKEPQSAYDKVMNFLKLSIATIKKYLKLFFDLVERFVPAIKKYSFESKCAALGILICAIILLIIAIKSIKRTIAKRRRRSRERIKNEDRIWEEENRELIMTHDPNFFNMDYADELDAIDDSADANLNMFGELNNRESSEDDDSELYENYKKSTEIEEIPEYEEDDDYEEDEEFKTSKDS